MVIDTSAIIAILFGEPENDRIAIAIANSTKRLISAFTALECGIVIEAKKRRIRRKRTGFTVPQVKYYNCEYECKTI